VHNLHTSSSLVVFAAGIVLYSALCLAMKSQRTDDLGKVANKRIRQTGNGANSRAPTSVGVNLMALSRSLATPGSEASSSVIAKAAAAVSTSSAHNPLDARVFATAIEIYLLLRSNDASAVSDIMFKLSSLTELIGAASDTHRGHSELPFTSSLSAGLAAGLGTVPCLTEPLFESRVGLTSGARGGAHSTAAPRASQARKVRQIQIYQGPLGLY